MKIQDYEKVQDLLRSKEKLNKLRRIFCYPYPRIFCPLKKFYFFIEILKKFVSSLLMNRLKKS